MAKLVLYRDKLRHNYKFLDKVFKKNNIEWSVVTKMLCGNRLFLKELLSLKPKQVCDSRLMNLKAIKEVSPSTGTIYIKPPAKSVIKELVRYADVSLVTEYETIRMLSREALKIGKVHRILIMMELGDLREGILGADLAQFYSRVFRLKGIKVVGIGTNFNCLHGVMPSYEKLTQLVMYKRILELQFKQKIPHISGGSTVTLPLLLKAPKKFPKEINHFRIGEALFFGADLFEEKTIKGMHPFTFELEAQVIEVSEKPSEPFGEMRANPSGVKYQANLKKKGMKSLRAIIDVGLLDVNPAFITPKNKKLKIVGTSSDMMVVDVTESRYKYPVGSIMTFQLKYMGALGLLNSKYIEKEVR